MLHILQTKPSAPRGKLLAVKLTKAEYEADRARPLDRFQSSLPASPDSTLPPAYYNTVVWNPHLADSAMWSRMRTRGAFVQARIAMSCRSSVPNDIEKNIGQGCSGGQQQSVRCQALRLRGCSTSKHMAMWLMRSYWGSQTTSITRFGSLLRPD